MNFLKKIAFLSIALVTGAQAKVLTSKEVKDEENYQYRPGDRILITTQQQAYQQCPAECARAPKGAFTGNIVTDKEECKAKPMVCLGNGTDYWKCECKFQIADKR